MKEIKNITIFADWGQIYCKSFKKGKDGIRRTKVLDKNDKVIGVIDFTRYKLECVDTYSCTRLYKIIKRD